MFKYKNGKNQRRKKPDEAGEKKKEQSGNTMD
jgi:hypothetical protein